MLCTQCGRDNAAGLDYCDYCGEPLQTGPAGKRKTEMDGGGGGGGKRKTAMDAPAPPQRNAFEAAMSGEVDDPFAPNASATKPKVNAPLAPPPPAQPQKRKTQFDHGDPFAPPSERAGAAVEDNTRIVGFLVTFDGAKLGKYWVLREGRTYLGSDPDICQVVVETDTNVSGKHAVMVWRNGKLRINDEMSTNGTYLNGEEVEEATIVPDGAIIGLGRTTRLICRLLDHDQVTKLWKVGGEA